MSYLRFTEAGTPSIPGFGSRCGGRAFRHIDAATSQPLWTAAQDEMMKSVNELLELFTRQAELENAMRQRGGARVTDEQELQAVKAKLASVPDAVRAAAQAKM
jgi:hypothetical protein